MFDSRREILNAIKRKSNHEALRAFALSSTVNFAKVCGLNPWNIDDLNNPYPICDEELAFYPWCPYLEDSADYLDKEPLDAAGERLARPIKLFFVGRDHFKTTGCEVALARRGLLNPYLSNLIFCDNEDKSSIRLSHISDIYQSDIIQQLFPDLLYPAGRNARYYYSSDHILMRKEKQQKRPTFEVFGLRTTTAGYHFNGVVWGDDLVNETNYRNPEIQEAIWFKIQQVYKFVASPGCEFWLTGTRYSAADAYGNFLDKDSLLKNDIVPGAVLLGCFEEDEHGNREAINFLRFCWNKGDKVRPVRYRGKVFNPVRESLEEKKASTTPISEWYSQMENNPLSTENATFSKEQFKKFIPCKAVELKSWIRNPDNVKNHILCAFPDAAIPKEKLNRAEIRTAIVGDIAYKAKKQNDFSVIIVAGQDANDDWYLMDGWRGKTDVDAGGLNKYFKMVYDFREKYGVRLALGIETHAKESTRAAAKMIANNLCVAHPVFHQLKDNSGGRNGMTKEVRIADALESHIAAGKLFVCEDFPKVLLDALIEEAITYPNGRADDTLDTLADLRQVFIPRKIATKKKVDTVKRFRIHNRLLRRAV